MGVLVSASRFVLLRTIHSGRLLGVVPCSCWPRLAVIQYRYTEYMVIRGGCQGLVSLSLLVLLVVHRWYKEERGQGGKAWALLVWWLLGLPGGVIDHLRCDPPLTERQSWYDKTGWKGRNIFPFLKSCVVGLSRRDSGVLC